MRFLAACFVLASLGCGCQVGSSAAKPDEISVSFNRESGVATIVVPAREGRVRWNDILRGIARSKGFDDNALAGALPDLSINIDSPKTPLILMGLNVALAPHLRLVVLRGETSNRPESLSITLDRKAILASSRWLRTRLREALRPNFEKTQDPHRSYGLTLDEGWEEKPLDEKLVVLIHGLHSTPDRAFEPFDDELRRRGFTLGTFGYPNDQPVETSARSLAAELRKVAERQPGRKVALLTTSMGALVARPAIEDPALDPGNVVQLIMVAPPNHGSRLAELAFAMELWEHVLKEEDKNVVRQFYSTIEDGLGEAYDDLAPGSEFFKRLNARPRNPNVAYTIFLGTAGFLDDKALDAARTRLKQAGESNRFVRFLGSRLDEILSDLDEVKTGKGDGAVSVERGQLEGVEDIVVLAFNHLMMVARNRTSGEKELRRQIIERLRESGH